MSTDARLDRLLDRQSIADLRHEYCRRVDDGAYTAWADLFAPDAVLDIEGRDPLVGPEAIRQFGTDVLDAEYARTAHLVCNPLVTVESEESATGRWSLLLCYERRDGTTGWRQGRYEETYVTVDDAWRFDAVCATFGVELAGRAD